MNTVKEHDCTDHEELFGAASSGNIRLVKFILEQGIDPNITNHSYETALHVASAQGHRIIVELLLDHGGNVNVKDCFSKSPLLLAASNGHLNVVKLLLQRGASLEEARDSYGRTILYYSQHHNQELEIIKLLLDLKFDLTTSSDESKLYTGRGICELIIHACECGHMEVLKLLFENGADFAKANKCENRAPLLHYAVRNNQMSVVKMLLDLHFPVDETDSYDNTALWIVISKKKCSDDDVKMIELLLDHGACTHKRALTDESIFYRACRSALKYSQAAAKVKLLLEYGADIREENRDGKTVVAIAFETNPAFLYQSYPEQLLCRILVRHAVKMYSENNDNNISENILNYIRNHCKLTSGDESTKGELTKFALKCENEIEMMKEEKLNGTGTTFYDVLTSKNLNQLANYTRNENATKVLDSNEYQCMFACYGSLLKNQFRRGVWRKSLLDKVKHFFPVLARVASVKKNQGLPRLSFYCIDKIYSFLDNKDLKNLTSVCDPANMFDSHYCDVQITSVKSRNYTL